MALSDNSLSKDILGDFGTICVFFLLSTLAQSIAFSYYITKSRERIAQAKRIPLALPFFILLLLFLTPSMLSKISAYSMKTLGISDLENRYYSFDRNKYDINALKVTGWKVIHNKEGTYSTVQGFALYKFGPITLLCPAKIMSQPIKAYPEFIDVQQQWEQEWEQGWSLALLWRWIKFWALVEWRWDWLMTWTDIGKHTSNCVTFHTDEIRKLGTGVPEKNKLER